MAERTRELLWSQITEAKMVISALMAVYGSGVPMSRVAEQLLDLIATFGTLEGAKGKRILDLGCGSGEFDIEHHPWLCRALLVLHAEPVGVDIGDLLDEDFEVHTLNLNDPSVLDIFPDRSFDGINMRYVPYTLGLIDEDQITTVREAMEKQIDRLLKPDGKRINVMTWV